MQVSAWPGFARALRSGLSQSQRVAKAATQRPMADEETGLTEPRGPWVQQHTAQVAETLAPAPLTAPVCSATRGRVAHLARHREPGRDLAQQLLPLARALRAPEPVITPSGSAEPRPGESQDSLLLQLRGADPVPGQAARATHIGTFRPQVAEEEPWTRRPGHPCSLLESPVHVWWRLHPGRSEATRPSRPPARRAPRDEAFDSSLPRSPPSVGALAVWPTPSSAARGFVSTKTLALTPCCPQPRQPSPCRVCRWPFRHLYKWDSMIFGLHDSSLHLAPCAGVQVCRTMF